MYEKKGGPGEWRKGRNLPTLKLEVYAYVERRSPNKAVMLPRFAINGSRIAGMCGRLKLIKKCFELVFSRLLPQTVTAMCT